MVKRMMWIVLAALLILAGGFGVSALSSHAQEQTSDTQDSEIEELLGQLTVALESNNGVRYDRDDYQPDGWAMVRDRCNVREVVLLAEAVLISGIDDDCQPEHGAWLSWFDGEKIRNSSSLDIDHLVPLAEAHQSGAARWSAARKESFANDLDLPGALTAVSASSNRSKGARDPASWKPPLESAWCQYAHDWIAVKAKWNLRADTSEIAALRLMLKKCEPDHQRRIEQPGRLEFILGQVSDSNDSNSDLTTQTGSTQVTYASCSAAEAAGVERQRGTRGNGRGFPAQLVPSARDGDNDGVVCER